MIQVACFGEILWDLFERRAGEYRREAGGAAANVATVLARLGVRASVVGAVGRDRFGDARVKALGDAGVDTRFVLRVPERTGITFVTRDENGEPRFLPYRNGSADGAMTARDVTPEMARAKWVVVGVGTPALAAATARFVERASLRGAEIMVDLNARAHLWPSVRKMQDATKAIVRRAALVKGSEVDLAALGRSWLIKHARRATLVVTHGDRDAIAQGAHGEVRRAAQTVRALDTTGAGDAFTAGLLAALVAARARPASAAWADPQVFAEALEIGHLLGARAVGRVGAVSAFERSPNALYRAVARMEDIRGRKGKAV